MYLDNQQDLSYPQILIAVNVIEFTVQDLQMNNPI